MNEQTTQKDVEDIAWASLNTPMGVDELKQFCRDIQRLFRINPMLEFTKWQSLGENEYAFSGKNISQEVPFDFEVKLRVSELPDGFQVDYGQGLKSSTIFKIEHAPQGSKLTITDRYDGLSEEDRKSRLGEVDKSITVWASYLQKFIISWNKWSCIAPWRWYMHRAWLPMKPTARRITYIILWISAVEIALMALGVAIYFSEYG
jgi:hypothetical protein